MSSYELADSKTPTVWSKGDYGNVLSSFKDQATNASLAGEFDDISSIISVLQTVVDGMPEGEKVPTDAVNKVVSMTKVHEPEWWELKYKFIKLNHEDEFDECIAQISWESPIHFGCDRGSKCLNLCKDAALKDLSKHLDSVKQELIEGSLTGRKVHGEGKF